MEGYIWGVAGLAAVAGAALLLLLSKLSPEGQPYDPRAARRFSIAGAALAVIAYALVYIRTGNSFNMVGLLAVVLFIAGLRSLLHNHQRLTSGVRALTPDEDRIRRLVREAYGEHITAARITFSNSDAIMNLELEKLPLSRLQVNLSSLARKHREEGLTPEVICRFLRIDVPQAEK